MTKLLGFTFLLSHKICVSRSSTIVSAHLKKDLSEVPGIGHVCIVMWMLFSRFPNYGFILAMNNCVPLENVMCTHKQL